ncbi:MAG: hypothetical protein LBF85_04095, partial [Tannerella sp.]|nr:hypothetical protein [Tannerella sp.]
MKNFFSRTKRGAFFRLAPKAPLTVRIALLLVCAVFQAGAETGYSQSKRISLDLRNVTVEDALNRI